MKQQRFNHTAVMVSVVTQAIPTAVVFNLTCQRVVESRWKVCEGLPCYRKSEAVAVDDAIVTGTCWRMFKRGQHQPIEVRGMDRTRGRERRPVFTEARNSILIDSLPMSIGGLFLLLLVLGAGHTALAVDNGTTGFPGYISQTLIDGNALSGASGVISINVASGELNLQANGVALAANLDAQRGRGISSADVTVLQRVDPSFYAPPDSAIAAIEGSAFQNASGLISVNQASGFANLQANEVTIMLGIAGEVVSEDVLAETFSDATRGGVELNPSGVRQVSIADTSFRGARGVAQVTQSAGSWNTTTNSFVLNMTAGSNIQ